MYLDDAADQPHEVGERPIAFCPESESITDYEKTAHKRWKNLMEPGIEEIVI